MPARLRPSYRDCPQCRIVSEAARKILQLYKTFHACGVPLALESRVLAVTREVNVSSE